jgi:hypothetical protein
MDAQEGGLGPGLVAMTKLNLNPKLDLEGGLGPGLVVCFHTRTHTHMHARTHAHGHAHKHMLAREQVSKP